MCGLVVSNYVSKQRRNAGSMQSRDWLTAVSQAWSSPRWRAQGKSADSLPHVPSKQTSEKNLAAFSEIDFRNFTTLGVDHVICGSFCFASDGVLSYMWHHVHSYLHSVSQCIIRTLVEGLFKRACIHIPKEKWLNSCVFLRSSSLEQHVFVCVCHLWALHPVAICLLKLLWTKRPLEGGSTTVGLRTRCSCVLHLAGWTVQVRHSCQGSFQSYS